MQEQHVVVLEDVLPLRVESGAMESRIRDRVMADNMALLKALLVMDDHMVSEDENREAISGLETKIDLLLLLVGKGIQGLDPLPTSYPCVLGAEDLFWESVGPDHFPLVDGPVCVSLFLRPRIAMPLILPGVLRETMPRHEAGSSPAFHYNLHFQLDHRVQESLDRLIFRHHRRAIARKKDHNHPSAE